MEGFLLGLSSGTACLTHCAPVMVPYFVGEAKSYRGNIVRLMYFLSGRLLGYLSFAVIAWMLGNAISQFASFHNLLFGIIFLLLSILMACQGLCTSKGRCRLHAMEGGIPELFIRKQWVMAILLGLLTGMNFCPPFLLAFTSSAYDGRLLNNLFFFFTFYLGTVFYFLPIVFLGVLNRESKIRTIGKMMSIIMAAYFFFKGLFLILGFLIG